MKRGQQTLALMLVIITLLALLPTSALAEYRVQSLKFDKWYTLRDSSANMTIYKFRITADSVVVINWKNYQSNNNWGYGAIYQNKDCENEVSLDTIFLGSSTPKSGSIRFVLYPGTYYLRMYDEAEKAQVKVSKKTVKSINKPNYSISKAITLKKGKKVEFAQSKNDYYTRWYKIKLPKSQSFSIYGYNGSYDVYDRNLNEIRTNINYDSRIITTAGAQPAGTYYIALYDYLSGLFEIGKSYQIYWK